MNFPKHYVGLDLARCIAVALVLISHYSAIWLPHFSETTPLWLLLSGSFGVQLFFVLSGFLIGRILDDAIVGRPSLGEWRTFMIRRWLRTLPLYFAVLTILYAFAPPVGPEPGRLALYPLFLQNFAWPMPQGNWFSVSWSLAVEEWFYLLFSILLFATARLFNPASARWITISVFIVVPLVLRTGAIHENLANLGAVNGEKIAKVVVYQLDGIAYGVLFAFGQKRVPRFFTFRWPLLAIGTLFVATVWIHLSGYWFLSWLTFPVLLSCMTPLISIGFALIFPYLLTVKRIVFVEPLVRPISRYSFSIYLIHLPIAAYLNAQTSRIGLSPLLAIFLGLLATYALSALCWRLFEQPILKTRPRQDSRPIPSINPR